MKFTREIERYLGDGYRMSFGTFTVPNTPSLSREQYKWLSKKLRRLLRRRPFKGRVFAAVAVIESDFNSDSQDWHVHIHIILIYDLCIPQREIEDAWRDLVNSEFNYVQSDVPGRVNPPCIVWIKKVELEDLRQTVNYLFKPQTFDNADAFAEYDCAVRNIRLVHSYGALRGRNGHSRKA